MLKNAIFGIDGKVTELEKKVKAPASSATGAAGRATARPGNTGATTARGAPASKGPTT